MNRSTRIIAIIGIIAALLALLLYSLERTTWVFSLFEADPRLALAAAIVVELAAIALLSAGGAIAALDTKARAWANRTLGAVLAVQALGNLAAGYLRGGRRTLSLFTQPGDDWAAYSVAAVLWLAVNLSVPVAILCLSKLLEQVLQHAPSAAQATESAPSSAPLRSAIASETPGETAYAAINTDGLTGNTSNTPAQVYTCRYCGAAGLTKAEQLTHGRQYKRAGMCKAEPEARIDPHGEIFYVEPVVE